MYSLILKDILIQKKMFRFSILYSIFILFAFNNPVFAPMTYVMGTVASAYMLLLGACAYEAKGNGEMVLNSFPLKRKDVVRSRYLAVFVFTFLSFGIIGLLGAVMRVGGLPFPQRYLNWFDLGAVLISMLLMSSIYLPLFFKFGYIQSRVFNVVMFMLVFFAPSFLFEYFQKHSDSEVLRQLGSLLQNSPEWLLGIVVVLLFFILYYGSYRLAVHIYQNREF